MLYKITGLKHYDFTKDGERVQGNSLFVIDLREGVNGMIFGLQVEKLSINDDLKNKLFGLFENEPNLMNKVVDIEFNRYGKPECITLPR